MARVRAARKRSFHYVESIFRLVRVESLYFSFVAICLRCWMHCSLGREQAFPSEMLATPQSARCHGITKAGKRCSITSRSTVMDAAGRRVGQPLALGAPCCLFHATLFHVCPAELSDAVVAYIDLETDSLDVLSGNIVEIGALVSGSRAAFSSSY